MKFQKLTKREYLLYSLTVLLSLGLDLLTKRLAEFYLKGAAAINLLPGIDFLYLNYVENPGAAFGILADKRYIFIILSLVAMAGIGVFLFGGQVKNVWNGVALSLILSGGVGNMIERLFKGYVVDFIDTHLWYFRLPGFSPAMYDFPVFNWADSAVCIGAGLLLLVAILDVCRETKANKANKKKTVKKPPESEGKA